MKPDLKGSHLKTIQTRAHAAKIAELAKILGTETAEETARVALFFGVTASWDLTIPNMIGADMEKVLMAGHELRWERPFEPDEEVVIDISLDDVFDKGDRRFAIVRSVFSTPAGDLIQEQRSTFTQPAPQGS